MAHRDHPGGTSGALPPFAEPRGQPLDDDSLSPPLAQDSHAPPALRRQAGGDSARQGWFIFAVVRHPSSRLWSAWQSKLLLREPRWPERFAGEPWLPRVPYSTADVVEDFQKFVLALPSDPDELPLRDRHFQVQSRLLAPERIPYTRVYRTGELELLDDLRVHLAAQGWEGQLDLTDRNETPLRPLESMFTPEIQDKIRSVYGQDFETFGYDGSSRTISIRRTNTSPPSSTRFGASSTAPSGWATWRSGPLSSARPRKPGGRSSRSHRNWPGFGGHPEGAPRVERLRAAADNRPLVKVKRRVRRLARLQAAAPDPDRDRDGTTLVSTTKTAGR